MRNKIISLALIVIVLLSITGCSESTSSGDNGTFYPGSSSTTGGQTSTQTQPQTQLASKADFEAYLRATYPITNNLQLVYHEGDNRTYTSDDKKVELRIDETSVNYWNNRGNWFKIGVFFEGDPALTKGQKMRILVRDGYNTHLALSEEQHFEILLSVLKAANEKYDYSYADIDTEAFIEKNGRDYIHADYRFNEEITFMMETNFDASSSVTSRDLYCDIF